MGQLLIIIGLPGSGKSHYLRALEADGTIDSYYDDYQKGAYGHEASSYFSANYSALLAKLKHGENVAITDIAYCSKANLDDTVESITHVLPETKVEKRYFENEPKKAIRNIHLRAREGFVEKELKFVAENSARYRPPSDSMPIYSSSNL